MEDKKIKYDLSYFMLEGGAKGAKRARGKGKSGQSGKIRARGSGKKGKTGWDESPENVDPNMQRYLRGLNEGRGEGKLSKEDWKEMRREREYQQQLEAEYEENRFVAPSWGNNNNNNNNGQAGPARGGPARGQRRQRENGYGMRY